MKTTTKKILTSCLITLNILSLPFGNGWASYAGNGKEAIAQEAAKSFGSNTQYGFIENKGQIVDQNGNPNSDVLFMNVSSGLKVQLTKKGFSYECYKIDRKESEVQSAMKQGSKLLTPAKQASSTMQIHRVDIELENMNQQVEVIAEYPASDVINYYTPGTPEEGITGVKHYRKVTYKNIYPNIDVEFVINDLTPALRSIPEPVEGGEGEGGVKKGGVEYNFIVRPGGNAENIRLKYEGANDLKLVNGKLQIATSLGDVEEHIPYSYQLSLPDLNTPVTVNYQKEGNTLSFKADSYDKTKTLVIDPAPSVAWGTYYGSADLEREDWGFHNLAIDANGFIYTTFGTNSTTGLATSGTHLFTCVGGAPPKSIVLAKFDTKGILQWATYYGDNTEDYVRALTVDNSNNVVIYGTTLSTSGIATAGAYKTFCTSCAVGTPDPFLAKIKGSDGTRMWGTYYDHPGALCNLVLAPGITTDAGNNIYIGADYTIGFAFNVAIAKINPTGTALLGEYTLVVDDFPSATAITGMKLDAGGNIIAVGTTLSTTGIATAGAYQTSLSGAPDAAFVIKINSTLTSKVWGTYYGGETETYGCNLALGSSDTILISGLTSSTTGIATAGAYQTGFGGGTMDGFLAKFSPDGTALKWATYYGGSGSEEDWNVGQWGGLALSSSGNIYLSNPNSYGTYGIGMFNPDGTNQWNMSFGGNETVSGGIAVVSGIQDTIYLAGTTSSTTGIAFGASQQPTYAGNYDAFLAKFVGNAGLPIELTTFTAVPVNNNTVLTSWATATEVNSDYFTVERSKSVNDGWEYVGTVDAAGNSSASLDYSLNDESPYAGVSYYRLKQTDFNGDFQYYGPVAVNLEGISIIALYPNPAIDHIDYSVVSSLESNIAITLVDVLGRKVISETNNLQVGENKLRLDVSNYPVGMYMIQLSTESGKYKTQKQFIVK